MQPPQLSTLKKTHRNLPHWQCESAIYWITFRMCDSLPQEKLRAWKEEFEIWKRFHPEPWADNDWREYNERFGERMEAWIDAGYGSCALKNPPVREVAKNCIFRFDGERLLIHSAVIMPNHVHMLVEPLAGNAILPVLAGMKNASAKEANRLLQKTGQFWQHESYDHIVRNPKQYLHFLYYIAENPTKARLRANEYWFYKNETRCNATAPAALSMT